VLARSSRSRTPYVYSSHALYGGANSSQVNPDIVGGLVVEVGDRTIDLSVSSKIAKMNKLLNDTL
jgi:F-type H+-transporting ATPase subunit O